MVAYSFFLQGQSLPKNRTQREISEGNRVARLINLRSEIESRNGWAKSSREMDEQNRVAKWMSEIESRNGWAKSSREIDEWNRVARVMSSRLQCSSEKSFTNKAVNHRVGNCSGRWCRNSTFFDGGWRTRAYDDGVSVCVARRWYRGVGGWVSLNEKKLINTVEC
jgi:hypothetical protein